MEDIVASLFVSGVAVAHGPALVSDRDVTLACARYPFLAGAVPSRQREFVAGRSYAAAALAELGAGETEVGRGPDGEPVFPPEYVGSISHCEGMCVAVAAAATTALALGVDVEREGAQSPAFVARVCGPVELASFRALGGSAEELALVVWSAKETLHKLLFPLTREVLALRSLEISLTADAFVARLLVARASLGVGATIAGRWRRSGGLVWTGAHLAPAHAEERASAKKTIAAHDGIG